VLAAGWLYYQSLLSQITALEVSNAQLETALALKAQEVASLKSQAASTNRRADVAAETLRAAQARVDALERVLEKHDLKYLIKRKPGLVTGVFQKGTAKVLKEVEDAGNATLK
jgi:hypothetical protein